jgi:N6-L-threonylcarbamoyladenine synthase
MIILAIDTSCDDTCIALLEAKKSRFKILANIVSSQVKVHKKWGGVVPTLAKREHQKNLPIIFKKILKKGKSVNRLTKIDLIAVTAGPGLEPCLWTGVNFAKDLARKLNLKIIPTNHIEAHILANLIKTEHFQNIFPAICLIVSGGHTQLILMKGVGKYKILGETRDDAAGECFDKVAKILGLGYPGGPIVAKLAKKPKQQTIHLPRPMIFQKNYDFSFSGLKTAVLYDFRAHPPKIRTSKKYIQEMCFETQQAIIDVLIKKTIRATKEFRVKAVILGGGVAANQELKKQFKEKTKKEIPYSKFYIPDSKYCTDNAVMIGVTAYFHRVKGRFLKNWSAITVNANLKIS